MALARLEGAIAISRFLARFPDYALNGAPVRGGRARIGETLYVPMPGSEIPVQVTSTVFYDVEGARLHG